MFERFSEKNRFETTPEKKTISQFHFISMFERFSEKKSFVSQVPLRVHISILLVISPLFLALYTFICFLCLFHFSILYSNPFFLKMYLFDCSEIYTP